MGFLAWIVFGLIAGVVAKWLTPGPAPGGFIVTVVLGIVGAAVGGFIGTTLGFGSVSGFDLRSMLVAIVGAIVVLVIYGAVTRKK